MMSTYPAASTCLKSQRENSRSPSAIGALQWLAISFSASTFSLSTGSSMNISLNGSSSLSQHLCHGPVHAAMEIDCDADVGSDGVAHRRQRWRRRRRSLAWLSTICSSSVPFIFTAVKPRSTTSRAALRHPPAGRRRSRNRPGSGRGTAPPSSSWTGTPSALPLMSQSAWSMPASALMWIGAAAIEAAAIHHGPVILDPERILADEVVGKFLDRCGDGVRPALRRSVSPQPVMPSSVSTLRNSQRGGTI